jgi:predicted Zn-dependent protease
MDTEPCALNTADYSMLDGHDRTLLAAQGYSELSMFDEALEELDSLPKRAASHATAIELRAVILMQAKRWKSALDASRDLCRREPEKSSGFIHAAFCLHELGYTVEARDMLLAGPNALHTEPTFHYNLACYECALGNMDLARMHLDKSFQLDKKFRDFARTDPDLAALR